MQVFIPDNVSLTQSTESEIINIVIIIKIISLSFIPAIAEIIIILVK